MSRAKRGTQSQAEADASSDGSHADVLFEYISTKYPTGVCVAALKDSDVPYPMKSYPKYKLTKREIDVLLEQNNTL
jgi:hypothetical protein